MIIKKIKLRNFKGIKSFEGDFNEEVTSIYGANGTGKTTLVDAYHWLLFDKDSQNRTQFNVKTLDENNKPIPQLEHEVEAVLFTGNDEVVLRKKLKENWVKRKNSVEPEFTGHKTEYFINELSKKKSDYQAFINDLIGEEVFKLISNPHYFPNMHWKDQREVLFQIAGGVSDQTIASGNPNYERLLNTIQGKKTSMDEYKRQLAAEKRKLTEELNTIPTRIDEVDQSKPQIKDFDALEKEIEVKQREIDALNDDLKAENENYQQRKAKIKELREQIKKVEEEKQKEEEEGRERLNKERREILATKAEKRGEIGRLKSESEVLAKEIEAKMKTRDKIEKDVQELREQWMQVNEEEPPDLTDTHCPTCGRKYDLSYIEEQSHKLEENWKQQKAESLKRINEKGKEQKRWMEKIDEEIKEMQDRKQGMEKMAYKIDKEIAAMEIPEEQKEVVVSAEHDKKIQELEEQINSLSQENETPEDQDKEEKKKALQKELDDLKKSLGDRDLIKKADQRITELNNKQLEISQALSDIQKNLDTVQSFTRDKIVAIEDNINSMFEFTSFKLFRLQVNGEEEETCEPMVDGVPWSDLNTAKKINAGIDIINVLSKHFGITAPIWIDQRETVTSLEVKPKSQIINLYVSENSDLTIN